MHQTALLCDIHNCYRGSVTCVCWLVEPFSYNSSVFIHFLVTSVGPDSKTQHCVSCTSFS